MLNYKKENMWTYGHHSTQIWNIKIWFSLFTICWLWTTTVPIITRPFGLMSCLRIPRAFFCLIVSFNISDSGVLKWWCDVHWWPWSNNCIIMLLCNSRYSWSAVPVTVEALHTLQLKRNINTVEALQTLQLKRSISYSWGTTGVAVEALLALQLKRSISYSWGTTGVTVEA